MHDRQPERTLRFGSFEFLPVERQLRADGQAVALGSRAFDVLACLLAHRSRVVTKQELFDAVWPDRVVEEHNIATQISTLRKLLGPQAIATVPGRGYRFTATTDAPAAPAVPTPPARSAAPLTPLLGRDEDLAALADLLQASRLVTLAGAGGIGKSLLGRHLVARLGTGHANGSCWVELASVADASQLPACIAEAVGVRLAGDDPVAALAKALSGLSMLLALDNAEHLAAEVGRVVLALDEAAPGVKLLVTSQAPLRLAAERVYRVGPLAVPPGPLPAALALAFGAVALFVERAREAGAHVEFDDAAALDVIACCRQLDGLPLAIELAAARAPLLGVRRLAAMLDDRLQLLTRNRDAKAPARQRTLRAALDWSHGLLEPAERTAFRRLAVIVGSASLGVIQHIVADESGPLDAWAALDALDTLVERSLVVLVPGEADEPRYRLLESPRALALEQLEASGEVALVQRRHATAIAAEFERAWVERWSGRMGIVAWSQAVSADAGNARAAIAWARAAGETEIAATVAVTAMVALPVESQAERLQLRELCEELADRVSAPTLRLWTLLCAALPHFHPSRRRSLELATQALGLARQGVGAVDGRWLLYRSLAAWTRALAITDQPQTERLIDAAAELEALEDPTWPPHRLFEGSCAHWMVQSLILSQKPGPDQARQVRNNVRRMLSLLQQAGGPFQAWTPVVILAELECGDVQAALELGEHELGLLATSRDDIRTMHVHAFLAAAHLMADQAAQARLHLREAWRRAVPLQMQDLWVDLPALLAALEGRAHAAARLVGHADAAYERRAMVRNALDHAARERSAALARAALGDDAFDLLVAEGQTLADGDAQELAFAEPDR